MKYIIITSDHNGQIDESNIQVEDVESEKDLDNEEMIFYYKLDEFLEILKTKSDNCGR